jgi:hypothetical protein
MARRGRPKKPAAERRNAFIQVRCQPDERQAFQRAAKAERRTLSDWARLQLVQAIGDQEKEAKPQAQHATSHARRHVQV